MIRMIYIKTDIFSKILIGIGLVGYLVLSLAGAVLHNHPVDILPFAQCCNATWHHHECCDCESHDNHKKHRHEHHHDCPVCYFNAVVVGALEVTAITILVVLLYLCSVCCRYNNFYPIEKSFCIYLRGPPSFSV